MSQQDYDAKLSAFTALAEEEIKIPSMPVAEAIQEAENLVPWCEDDQAELTNAGLDWLLVEDLSVRASACRYAESIWAKEFRTREDAQKEWKAKSPDAFDLRDVLVHDFLFAFRKESDLKSKVQIISEGGSNADMLQDLSDLSVLGKENQALLEAIGSDVTKLDTAAQNAEELSALLAQANGEAGDDGDTKILRDKAYSYMKAAVDEIRATGQHVFWRDEDRLKGYVNSYFKKKRQSKKKKPQVDL